MDKLDIIVGMIERLDEKTDRKFDEVNKSIMDFRLSVKQVEVRHDNCPGEKAIKMLDSPGMKVVSFFSNRPLLAGMTGLGGLVLLIFGIVKVFV